MHVINAVGFAVRSKVALMQVFLIFRRGRQSWPGLAAVLFLLFAASSHAAIDLNGNGMSDVWEWLYNAVGVTPSADTDGDGFSNFQEAIAGTNPFDSNSYPRISLG